MSLRPSPFRLPASVHSPSSILHPRFFEECGSGELSVFSNVCYAARMTVCKESHQFRHCGSLEGCWKLAGHNMPGKMLHHSLAPRQGRGNLPFKITSPSQGLANHCKPSQAPSPSPPGVYSTFYPRCQIVCHSIAHCCAPLPTFPGKKFTLYLCAFMAKRQDTQLTQTTKLTIKYRQSTLQINSDS